MNLIMNIMNRSILYMIAGVWLVSFPPSFAQNTDVPCSGQEYHQFDFWLGNWEVYNQADTIVGYNHIVQLHDECVIQENWKSKGTYTGTSYNFYDPLSDTWNQVWIDNQGGHLILKGRYAEGKMVMESELKKSQKGISYYDRITWYNNGDGTVRQLWEMVGIDGVVLNVLFDGLYRKKNTI